MELLTIILVNLIVLFLIYVVLSMRFSRAVEKVRKGGIPRELYDNLKSVIQYVDNGAERTAAQTKSAYEMLKRMESLKAEIDSRIERLESLASAEESGSKKSSAAGRRAAKKTSSRKKKSKSEDEIRAMIYENEDREEVTYNHKRRVNPVVEESPIDRLIPELEEDSFINSGPVENRPVVPKQENRTANIAGPAFEKPEPKTGTPVIERIGSGIRKFLGIGEMNLPARPAADTGHKAASVPKEPRTAQSSLKESTNRLLEEAGKSVQKEAGPVKTGGFDHELKRMVEKTDESSIIDGPAETGKKPAAESVDEFLKQQNVDARKLTPKQSNLLLRKLIALGFDMDEIADTFQMTISELELLASLPETRKKYRKGP